MKIAFVCESLSFGGIERVISVLSDAFVEEGNSVSVLTSVSADASYKINEKIKVTQLAYRKSGNSFVRAVDKIRSLCNNIKENKYDVVIAFGFKCSSYTLLARRGNKTKVVISERTDPDSYANKYLRKMRDIIYKKADLMVCQTEYVKEFYTKRKIKNIHVIPNPIKSNLPEPYVGERRKEIVNFCRLQKQKNVLLLLQAFSDFHKVHPEYTLKIYGEGELKDSLLEYIDSKNLSECVSIVDFTKDIHNKILDSAMFVSSSNYEGISNSMLESLALGLPCVCTDCPVGGASLVIENNVNGLLVPVKDREALFKAMKYMADNPEKAAEMGRKACAVRTRFSVESIIEKWKKALKSINL